ncbi:MAG: sulfate/molybdate ABC transporter ATP-binding protein, partial [Eubacteriales bacterium]
SGSGKSMTLRCIAGIETPDSGKIILNGKVLFDSDKGINIPASKRKVGFLFQNYALFPHMTVKKNIAFALDKLSKDKRDILVHKKIVMMNLQGLENRLPAQLSGGEQQRVALARALIIEPDILLLDEPFSALDEHLRSILIKQLTDTLHNYNGVTIFVTHNMDEAYRLCQSLVVLNQGTVEAQGAKEDVFNKPPTIAAARITGCNNYSAAKYINKNTLEAVDWGIHLITDIKLGKSINNVGIRAHYIREKKDEKDQNVFPCWLIAFNESPFKVSLYLNIGKEHPNNYHVQWEITKNHWMELKDKPLPWSMCFDPDKLLVFK